MPEMDGYQGTHGIRQQERVGFRIPIIALTANVLAAERARCVAAGTDDDVPKRLDSGVLVERLQGWLPSAPVPDREMPSLRMTG